MGNGITSAEPCDKWVGRGGGVRGGKGGGMRGGKGVRGGKGRRGGWGRGGLESSRRMRGVVSWKGARRMRGWELGEV